MIPTTPIDEQQMARRWIDAWRMAAPELDRQRRQEIRQADTGRAIQVFDGLFEAAVRDNPPATTSGLIEQQRYFGLAPR